MCRLVRAMWADDILERKEIDAKDVLVQALVPFLSGIGQFRSYVSVLGVDSISVIGLLLRVLVEEIPADGSEIVAELSVSFLPMEISGLEGLVGDAGACTGLDSGFFLLE